MWHFYIRTSRSCHIYLLTVPYKKKCAIKSNLYWKILYGTERETFYYSRTCFVSWAKRKALCKHSLQEISHTCSTVHFLPSRSLLLFSNQCSRAKISIDLGFFALPSTVWGVFHLKIYTEFHNSVELFLWAR